MYKVKQISMNDLLKNDVFEYTLYICFECEINPEIKR